jgi:hypothetical protein
MDVLLTPNFRVPANPNGTTFVQAMCFMMDPVKGPGICYVQFPQRFDGIDSNDRYSNHNTVFYDINMKGLDSIQGPVYVGTGCCFRRQVGPKCLLRVLGFQMRVLNSLLVECATLSMPDHWRSAGTTLLSLALVLVAVESRSVSLLFIELRECNSDLEAAAYSKFWFPVFSALHSCSSGFRRFVLSSGPLYQPHLTVGHSLSGDPFLKSPLQKRALTRLPMSVCFL